VWEDGAVVDLSTYRVAFQRLFSSSMETYADKSLGSVLLINNLICARAVPDEGSVPKAVSNCLIENPVFDPDSN